MTTRSSKTRRQFLATSAVAAAPMQGQTNDRIDCQSHLFSSEFLDWLEKRKKPPYVYRKGGDRFVVVGEWHRKLMPRHADVAAKLADMDRAGIRMTALSINDPGPEFFGSDSLSVANTLNDFIADVVRQHPTRFFGLATLPFDSEANTLKELDRCVSKLGMRGILLYSNLDGKFPDERQFRGLFAEAERRQIPLLLHPAYPMTYEATKGYEMTGGLALMFDTTIALSRLILSGVLEQHPKLQLVCPHVGGTLPYIVGRIDHQTMVLKRGADNIRRAPSEYLKQVWLDTVSPLALAIKYGCDFVGTDRMLYASDHPWVDPTLIASQVQSLRLPANDEAKIFSANARRLFRLDAAPQSA
jgi:predicted TIM-barrel fold metal-dependent hydrolase